MVEVHFHENVQESIFFPVLLWFSSFPDWSLNSDNVSSWLKKGGAAEWEAEIFFLFVVGFVCLLFN